jgi:hypothetical protein
LETGRQTKVTTAVLGIEVQTCQRPKALEVAEALEKSGIPTGLAKVVTDWLLQ